MRYEFKVWYKIIIIIFGVNIFSFGQTIGFFSIDGAIDSNPFRYLEAESSLISSIGFGIQPQVKDIFISYTGNYTRFETLAERNFYWHQAALFTEIKNFEFGILFEQTLNGIDYEYLNSNQYSGYTNSNFNIGEFNFYGNLEGTLNYYSQLDELDNFNFDAGIKMQKSFESGTTIILGTIFHYKKYLTNIIIEDSTIMTGTSQGGQGQGGMGTNTIYSEYDAPSVSQLQYWFRIAQSITKTTGLAAQYQSRAIVGGTSRYFSGINYNYADESQVFDDPLGYENQRYGAEVTQLIPLGIVLKGAFYKNKKEYATQGIYTDAENYDLEQLREDTRSNARITLQKRIASKFFGSKNVSINLTYQWVDNESNSYLYNYESSYVGLGFSLNF
jgi:hypothetical protein